MRHITKIFLILLLIAPYFSLSYGYISVDYNLEKEKDFKQVINELKNNLEKKGGITIHKTLPLSEAIKSRGVSFEDYYILVGCVGSQTEEILKKHPDLSNVLPCSIPVYKKDGKIKVSVLNYKIFLSNTKNIQKKDLRYIKSVYKKIELSLFRLGFKKTFYGYKKNINPNSDFTFSEKIGNQNIEDFSVLFKTSLEGINLNILDEMSLNSGKLKIYLVCNLTYGAKILTSIPQFGVLAPCRINIYSKEDESLSLSMINVQTFLKIFERVLNQEQKEIFLKIDKDIKSIITDLKGG